MKRRLLTRRLFAVVPAFAVVAALTTIAAGSPVAAATPAGSTGWRIIRTIATTNTDLLTIVAFRHSAPWLGGAAEDMAAKEFYAVVYHLTGGPLHPVRLATQLGTNVDGLSATSPTNVWASLQGVPGGQVDRLTRHGWHAYSLGFGASYASPTPVVTTGPKNAWVFTYNFTTKVPYGYRFDGSTWHRRVLPADPDSNSSFGYVSASASNNIWTLTFVGNRPAAMRYNGSKWQVTKFPVNLGPPQAFLGPQQILALSPKDVWVTFSPNAPAGDGLLVLLHWNGTTWRKISGKLPKDSLIGAIASDGAGGVWLAAANTSDTLPLILHFSHHRWSTFAVPKDNGKLIGIEQMMLIPGTRSVLGTAILQGSGESTGGSAVVKFGP